MTVLFTARGSDPEGQSIVYSLVGEDAAAFEISATGEVRFRSAPNFEAPADADRDNLYQATVIVTGSKGATASAPFTIRVTDLGATNVPADVEFPDLTPTDSSPVVAGRIAANRWLIRTLSVRNGTTADFDEFQLYDPSGEGVDHGWQLADHRAMVRSSYRKWISSGETKGNLSTQEFAWRMGRSPDAYESGGDEGLYRYAGFGHGRMHSTLTGKFGANSIILDGWGQNHLAAPVGTTLYGRTFDVLWNYNLAAPDGIDVARATMLHSFTNAGLLEFVSIEMLADNIAGNDSYLVMYPFRGDIVKPVGLVPYESKQTTNTVRPWGLAPMSDLQFYYSNDATVMATLSLQYGQPIRRPDGSLHPYALNKGDRFFISDNQGLLKFYGAGMSSELGDTKSAWPLSGTYEGQIRIRTSISESGPH